MWDGFNKRKFPRLHLNCEIVISPQGEKKALKTTTENVGQGGVAILLDDELERFEHCQIGLELRKGEPAIQCTGKVVWIIPSKELKSSQKHFDTGIEFLDMGENARQRLNAFLTKQTSKQN